MRLLNNVDGEIFTNITKERNSPHASGRPPLFKRVHRVQRSSNLNCWRHRSLWFTDLWYCSVSSASVSLGKTCINVNEMNRVQRDEPVS